MHTVLATSVWDLPCMQTKLVSPINDSSAVYTYISMVNVQQQTLCMARLQCSFMEAILGSHMCVCMFVCPSCLIELQKWCIPKPTLVSPHRGGG